MACGVYRGVRKHCFRRIAALAFRKVYGGLGRRDFVYCGRLVFLYDNEQANRQGAEKRFAGTKINRGPMFSFFKKNQSNVEVPEWASFFNQREYKEFLKAIERCFYEKNIVYTIDDQTLSAEPNDFGFGQMGLKNVAQVCGQTDISFYQKTVNEHFDTLLRTCVFDKEFGEIKNDYEQIKEYLGVRLYPHGYFAQVGLHNTIGKDFSGNIYAAIVYDTPDSIESVSASDAEKWGKSVDDLFETGIKNIWSKYGVQLSEEEIEGFNIWFAQAEHFFTPNIVFDKETLKDLSGREGLLIGLPHRHAAILYPVNDALAADFIDSLIMVVNNMYNEGPGSLSNNIFWYKDGYFENLPYEIEDGAIVLSPPESFTSMLESLPPEEP